MGKGSGRRPTFISEDQFQENYDRIFGKKERRRYEPPPLKDDVKPANEQNEDSK